MIIPMLCATHLVILLVWFLVPRVSRLMIHTPTTISIFVCLGFVLQAEGGIRDADVTGVQTCALPIYVKQNIVHIGCLTIQAARDPVARLNRPIMRRVRSTRQWKSDASQMTMGILFGCSHKKR